MARRSNRPPQLKRPPQRPPILREFSAGGLVYRRRSSAIDVVLAARRHPRSGELVWTIPKGHVEPGETTRAAAQREVREETGLEVTVEQPLGELTYWYVRRDEHLQPVRIFKRVRFFLMCFRGGGFENRDQEMDEVDWFALDDAEQRAAHDNERTLVRKARELLEEAAR